MGEKKQPVVKKKVRPYPIEAMLEIKTVKKPIEVIYLTPMGCIVHLGPNMIHVGDYYNIVFELPVLSEFINANTRVLKTYDRATESKPERMAELHFQNLTKEHKSRIVAFINAIGQDK